MNGWMNECLGLRFGFGFGFGLWFLGVLVSVRFVY